MSNWNIHQEEDGMMTLVHEHISISSRLLQDTQLQGNLHLVGTVGKELRKN